VTGRADYAERREARIDRLRSAADKARAESSARLGAADRIASCIPMGQPILVGHHSERRARKDQERIRANMRKGIDAADRAKVLDRRADAAEEGRAISSDNPDAVALLRAKLADVEADHARWKAALRPKLTREQRLRGEGPEIVERNLLAMGVPAISAEFIARMGGGAQLSNRAAEARRVRERIATLEAAAARPARAPETFGDVEIREEDNRVCIEFPGKPDDDMRTQLKRAGFRWAPSMGAWVRMASEQAWHAARRVVGGEP
jgi:hypothetical protein